MSRSTRSQELGPLLRTKVERVIKGPIETKHPAKVETVRAPSEIGISGGGKSWGPWKIREGRKSKGPVEIEYSAKVERVRTHRNWYLRRVGRVEAR